jgi:outer membrane cobalamin receptor
VRVEVEEEITVSSRAAESETGSVSLIDREEIDRSEARDAGALVRSAAGLHLLTSGSRGGTSHAFVRGGDANFTLILLDGVPLNDATDVQGGAFNLSTLGVDDVESVEVLRGPQSMFFGSSAVAGAINLVTRDGRSGRGGQLRLEAGESSLRHAGGGGGGEDFFVGARFDEERGAVGDDSHRQIAVQGAAGVYLGPRAALRVTGRATGIESADYPEGSGGPVFGSGELRHTDGGQLTLGLRWSLAGAGWRHGFSASGNRAENDVDSPGIAPVVPPSTEDRVYRRAQLAWIATRELSARVGLTLGAQLDREDGETESTLFLPPFLGGDTRGDYRIDRETPGIFAAATVESGPLVVEGGVRADDPEALPVEWSPRAGLRFRIADSGWLLRSAWSRAFKLPSFFALASPPALGGNPSLLPESSTGVDAGVEYQRGPDRFGLTLFRSTYEDLIDFDFERFQSVNRSRIEAEGIELAARWRPVERLLVATAWTLQDVDGASTANVVLHSPERFGSLSLELSPSDAVRLRLEARSVGETEDVQIPLDGSSRVGGYEVVDVQASWRAAERWLLRAGVDNAAGEEYQHFVGFPQPGRRARIGIEYALR